MMRYAFIENEVKANRQKRQLLLTNVSSLRTLI